MKVLILNSVGFSDLGWVTQSATQEILGESLMRANLEVAVADVASVADVDQLLAGLAPDTLVWPNAYHVRIRSDSPKTVWLADILEARRVPFIGSPAAAQRTLLHKDECQARLSAAGIPVPNFTVITERGFAAAQRALEAAGLAFPVIVKPTASAGSRGISGAHNLEQLVARIDGLFDRFGPRAIVEEYLPSADLTIGVLEPARRNEDSQSNVRRAQSKRLLLPTWTRMRDRTAATDLSSREDHLGTQGQGKQMSWVRESGVLEQIETIVPQVLRVLGIHDITRIDGRLDASGELRIFDVNGMPKLDCPDAVFLRQVMTAWPRMEALTALDRVAASLVASAAARYGLKTPVAVGVNALTPRRVRGGSPKPSRAA